MFLINIVILGQTILTALVIYCGKKNCFNFLFQKLGFIICLEFEYKYNSPE